MPSSAARQPRPSEQGESDALLSFHEEKALPPAGVTALAPKPRARKWRPFVVFALAVLCLAAGVAAYLSVGRPPAPPPPAPPPVVATGTATISSRPEGATVMIDGIARGVTPLRLVLPVGEHTLDLQNGAGARSVPLAIEAGTIASHYIDLAAPVSVGRLEITSDPPGARVTMDGTVRGSTPLVLSAVNPGQRRVVIGNDDNTVTRLVTVTAGATSTVMASLAPAGVSAGWVSIQSPIELQVMENGRLIGVTGAERLMLPGGRHDLELVGPSFEFRTPLSVQIQTGKTAAATVAIPNGSLSINALPWAEVAIDGRAVGTTPLANLSIPIGHHEVVWRHPQLGERRQTVAVTRVTPVRVGVDLNR